MTVNQDAEEQSLSARMEDPPAAGQNAAPACLPMRYAGARVTVHYINTYSDTGHMVSADNYWLELLKDNGERLLVPVTSIRLMKLLDYTDRSVQAATLLRPSGPEGSTDADN